MIDLEARGNNLKSPVLEISMRVFDTVSVQSVYLYKGTLLNYFTIINLNLPGTFEFLEQPSQI